MKIKSKIEGASEWLFIEEIPDVYNPNILLSEKHTVIKRTSVKKLINYQITSGGLFLMYSSMQFNDAVRILSEINGETVTSQFIFYGEAQDDAKRIGGKKAHYKGSRHNIRYIPSSKGSYEMTVGMEYNYFLMVLSKDYYFHLVDSNFSLHADFVRRMMNGKHTSLTAEDMYVTFEMKRVIKDICDTKKTGEIKKLFIESKVLELLMLQLEQMQDTNNNDKLVIKNDDLKKIENARDILDLTFANPPTIKELSKEIGLNDFKLKRGFKEYYGTTVYGYITRLRMETARKLILEEGKTIGEVAQKVGFKHQAHLTDAFKKYFGILPSEIKV